MVPPMSRPLARLLVAGLLLLSACGHDGSAAAPAAAASPAPSAGAQRIATDVRTLADDRMEGRRTGTAG